MSENFTNESLMNDPDLRKAIMACTDPEAIKETLKAFLTEKGVIARDRGDAATVTINPRMQEQHQPAPENAPVVSGFKYSRDLKFGGVGRRRDLVLSANTIEQLDAMEAEILHYPKK